MIGHCTLKTKVQSRNFWIKYVLLGHLFCNSIYILAQPNGSLRDDSRDATMKQSVRVMFYNVENLFFPADDSLKSDEDFTPDGSYYWNFYRYRKKLNNIARVIIAVGEWNTPSLIGLCEIEEQRVLQDLIYKTPLKGSTLNYIHINSPDRRGIDVALLYDNKNFDPIYYEAIEVCGPEVPDLITRDILYVKGLLLATDTLHLFINHWPSRRGGKIQSQPRRMLAASCLKAKTDSLKRMVSNPQIIIMGDFNDEPDDDSIAKVILGDGVDSGKRSMVNLMSPIKAGGEGTYSHIQNFEVWEMIDQIILSASYYNEQCDKNGGVCKAQIFKSNWLLDSGTGRPLRTYRGLKYFGGYSDHLPVYIDIMVGKSGK